MDSTQRNLSSPSSGHSDMLSPERWAGLSPESDPACSLLPTPASTAIQSFKHLLPMSLAREPESLTRAAQNQTPRSDTQTV